MDEPPEPDDEELANAPLPQCAIEPAADPHDALLRHIRALRDDIARYSWQIAEIEAGRGDPGANTVVLRSALKHRTEHLALMEAKLTGRS